MAGGLEGWVVGEKLSLVHVLFEPYYPIFFIFFLFSLGLILSFEVYTLVMEFGYFFMEL